MALETLTNTQAVRNLNQKNSKIWDNGGRWEEAYGEKKEIIENAGDQLTDAAGELHVDVSADLDDIKFVSCDAYGAAQDLSWTPHKGDSTLKITTLVGNFQKGETITGGTSGATAVVASIAAEASGFLQVNTVVGTFVTGETITGGTSSATAVLTTEKVAGVDTVELAKQRVVIMEGRSLATGAALAGSVQVLHTFKAEGIPKII
jgi:hypothetical protein